MKGFVPLAGNALLLLGAYSAPISQGRAPEGFLDGADGHSLFYRLRGAGPDTIVIVHGFQGNNQNYPAADLVAVIVEPTLLFYDQRGGGRNGCLTWLLDREGRLRQWGRRGHDLLRAAAHRGCMGNRCSPGQWRGILGKPAGRHSLKGCLECPGWGCRVCQGCPEWEVCLAWLGCRREVAT